MFYCAHSNEETTMKKETSKQWALFWSPEGKRIAVVSAPNERLAKRKAPKPYRKYLGEIYVEPFPPSEVAQ